MADLAHWNFSDHFTAKEAASLIVGVDPGADDQNKRVPVLRRITQAYGKAENNLNAAATYGSGLDYWLETCPFDDDALLSEQMLLVVASEIHYGLECYADNYPNFNFAFFTRTEVCRWLKATGLKSVYKFDPSADAPITVVTIPRQPQATTAVKLVSTQNTLPVTSVLDPERRLARLVAIGGSARHKNFEWRFTKFNDLVDLEKSEGRKRTDTHTIRKDLKEAAQADLEAKKEDQMAAQYSALEKK